MGNLIGIRLPMVGDRIRINSFEGEPDLAPLEGIVVKADSKPLDGMYAYDDTPGVYFQLEDEFGEISNLFCATNEIQDGWEFI